MTTNSVTQSPVKLSEERVAELRRRTATEHKQTFLYVSELGILLDSYARLPEVEEALRRLERQLLAVRDMADVEELRLTLREPRASGNPKGGPSHGGEGA